MKNFSNYFGVFTKGKWHWVYKFRGNWYFDQINYRNVEIHHKNVLFDLRPSISNKILSYYRCKICFTIVCFLKFDACLMLKSTLINIDWYQFFYFLTASHQWCYFVSFMTNVNVITELLIFMSQFIIDWPFLIIILTFLFLTWPTIDGFYWNFPWLICIMETKHKWYDNTLFWLTPLKIQGDRWVNCRIEIQYQS